MDLFGIIMNLKIETYVFDTNILPKKNVVLHKEVETFEEKKEENENKLFSSSGIRFADKEGQEI